MLDAGSTWGERLRHAAERVLAWIPWDDQASGRDAGSRPGDDGEGRGGSDGAGPAGDGRRRGWGRIGGSVLDGVTGDCAVYESRRGRAEPIPMARAPQAIRGTDGYVWIGLQDPSQPDVEAVAAEFGLPELAVEDAVRAHQRPKLEVYGDLVFAVLKPVHYVNHDEVVDVAEVAMFLGPRFVVTVRHGNTDVLSRVREDLDGDAGALMRFGPAGVLYRAADLAADGYLDSLKAIDLDVDEIETQVFAATDGDGNSERIYKLKREIAEFRRAVQPFAPPLAELASGRVPHVGEDLAPYFRDVHDHVLRATDAIEGHDRLLSDVLQADLARVATEQSRIAVRQNEIAARQNEDMRKISAWAAIGLVPTGIAGIYGMNFDNIPELHWRYGYFIVLGVIGAVCVGLHRLFRRNGWL